MDPALFPGPLSEFSYGQPSPDPAGLPSPRRTADIRERLLDLAYDATSYLRRHAKPAVRVSAALLLAASLAACDGASETAELDDSVLVTEPLSEEVRNGLPTAPGRYQLVPGSIARDSRGVYHFNWLAPGQTGEGAPASASLVKLSQAADENYLEIPAQGDPTLHLRSNTEIALASADQLRSNPYPYYSAVPAFVYWRPFFVGGGFGPAYYDPPMRTVPASGTVDGARSSTVPPPPAERTVGISRAVSGRAGGTGSGGAASMKSGADTGGKSSTTAPRSSGFSAGSGSSSSASSSG